MLFLLRSGTHLSTDGKPWNKRTTMRRVEDQHLTCFLCAPTTNGKCHMPQQGGLEPVMTVDQVNQLLQAVYPQLNGDLPAYLATEIFPGGCTVRLNATERHLRPGGTVSGPSLFTLADIGGYVCVLSHAGPDALSVTTSLNINFVRKAEAGAIDGHCRILKLGKSLMVFDIDIVAGPEKLTVAHATGTYSIPPKR
jgi:uncharacterized protein (TIGR00369 family)